MLLQRLPQSEAHLVEAHALIRLLPVAPEWPLQVAPSFVPQNFGVLVRPGAMILAVAHFHHNTRVLLPAHLLQ